MEHPRWIDRGWYLFWAVASSIWIVSAAAQMSGTFDEPFYVKWGMHAWRTGSYDRLMRAGTMPLPIDVEMFPVFIWEQFRDMPFDTEADFDQILPVARLGNLLFWWVLLFYSWRLGALYGGAWAGRLAVMLLACEPTFLAHAGLATTDVAVTACILAFVYHYSTRNEYTSRWRRFVLPGICYGLALTAKASALVFGPMVMVILELQRRWESSAGSGYALASYASARRWWTNTLPFRRDFLRICLIGLSFVMVYCGSEYRSQRSFIKWASTLPEGTLHDVMCVASDRLRIFPNAGEALVYQIKHNIRGHGVYLFGEWDHRAKWYYFPVALVVKLSLPVLLCVLILLVWRPGNFFTPVGWLTLALLLFTINCRVQIGIRLVMPLMAFLMVTLSIALVKAVPQPSPFKLRILTAGLAGVFVLPAATVWPDGLCYTNEIWGGSSVGYRYLSDSNYDWGQGLKELSHWHDKHPGTPLRIWYYGTDPASQTGPEFVQLVPGEIISDDEAVAIMQGSYIAVGTSILHNNPDPTPSATKLLQLLRQRQPIARTMTFFIYDFTDRSVANRETP